ncbi:MAG: L-2-amino-thiazoline-4-carboxylic acid hydrolase [Anaerolineaceae bacterium]
MNNNIIPISKKFFPGFLPLVGQKQYERMLNRYYDLYANHDMPENPILKHHLVQGILPGLAYYQILREDGKLKESALEKINQAFETIYAGNIRSFQKIGKIPFIYGILRLYIKTAMREYPAAGWDMDWQQVDGDAIRFRMNTCFYFNTLSGYGAPELTASFCRVDDLIYGSMSAHVLWQRTQTIARGAEYCDFCFANAKRAVK